MRIVGVFGDVGGADFGFDKFFEAFREVGRDRELDLIVLTKTGMLAGGLDSTDELTGSSLFFKFFGEGFV